MNMESFMVLGIVAVLLVFAVVSFRKKGTGECDENCCACGYSCNKEDVKL